MAASHDNPEEKKEVKQETRDGFLNQEIFENLTVNIDGEIIKPFLNPHFLDVLHQQAKDRFQPEPLNFLRELYDINQKTLTLAELQGERDRLMQKYMSNPNDENYLNVTNTQVSSAFEERKKNGELLTVFIPIIGEMGKLVNTNWAGTANTKKDKCMPALLAAYEQDKHDKEMSPITKIISEALKRIEEIEKDEKKETGKTLQTLEEILKKRQVSTQESEEENKGKNPEKTRSRTLFSHKVYPKDEIEAANRSMEMIKQGLIELLEASNNLGNTPSAIQKRLKELANENHNEKGLWGMLGELSSKLSSEPNDRHLQKVRVFLDMLDQINKDIDALDKSHHQKLGK